MRTKLAVVLVFLSLGWVAFSKPNPALSESVDTKPGRRVTLLNRKRTGKSDNWAKAVVSFGPEPVRYGSREPTNDPVFDTSRGPSNQPIHTQAREPQNEPFFPVKNRNNWDLLYGGLNYNGDKDWLKVSCDPNSWSRIRDLGEMDWSDDIDVPVLPILPCRTNERCGRIHIPSPQSGKSIADEDLNPHIAKPIAGHMYVVHRHREKPRDNRWGLNTLFDYYVLLRVEELKPNESCTITWKRVPAPKK